MLSAFDLTLLSSLFSIRRMTVGRRLLLEFPQARIDQRGKIQAGQGAPRIRRLLDQQHHHDPRRRRLASLVLPALLVLATLVVIIATADALLAATSALGLDHRVPDDDPGALLHLMAFGAAPVVVVQALSRLVEDVADAILVSLAGSSISWGWQALVGEAHALLAAVARVVEPAGGALQGVGLHDAPALIVAVGRRLLLQDGLTGRLPGRRGRLGLGLVPTAAIILFCAFVNGFLIIEETGWEVMSQEGCVLYV